MDFPQDGLKWFGEGFDGFPKKLPEDLVEYLVFIIDSHLSDTQTRERLQAFQRSLHQLRKKFLEEYIWQRDAIDLELVRDQGMWLLKGRSYYGDSVADEWLIVWFLRELSKEFKDAWIRIYDTDGEFLLIEAANALPTWVNPEVAESRVWINNHRLLIIPLAKAETNPAPLDIKDALKILHDTPARPQHYPRVEKEAFHRLNHYPAAISENQHHATLPLPRKVAHILSLNPNYISAVVEVFYLRDPVSIRLLQPEKSKTPLVFPPEDFVDISVRFTKVLYAQLIGQFWCPPSPWDNALQDLVKIGKDMEKADVGIKVAAGMQILLSHSLYAPNKPVREIQLLLEDLESGDDALPTDAEIEALAKRQDDESWLNIDFLEFEKELAGKGASSSGFGDKNAQENLKKMVERFNAFLADDEADHQGATPLDPMDVDNDSDAVERGWEDPETDSDDGNEHVEKAECSSAKDFAPKEPTDKRASRPQGITNNAKACPNSSDEEADSEYVEYEAAYEKFMMLSPAEKHLLTEEARELALAQDAEQEEDEGIKKLTEAMESELFGYGALNLGAPTADTKFGKGLMAEEMHKGKGKGKAKPQGTTSEDDDCEPLDEDYNLVENMLQAFKGQAGTAGPAGNMMKLMGVQLPRDADDEIESVRKIKDKEI